MIIRNENLIDRLTRGLIASLLLVGGYYWLGGLSQVVVYVLGVVALFTAITGFCALYAVLGVNTLTSSVAPKKWLVWLLAVLIVTTVAGGSYGSSFFTKKIFVEDFNAMNNNYKQTLFNTGQDKRTESIANYEKLAVSFPQFQAKYAAYKPVAIRSDAKFDADLEKIHQQIIAAKDKVYNGDLKSLHYELESIRPAFQEILKRDNFSMIGMALSDFHDAMEVAIEGADDKAVDVVTAAYGEADTRLKTVEEMENDAEIQVIRANLEALDSAAKNNQVEALPKLGADLKSSFIKVYLKRN